MLHMTNQLVETDRDSRCSMLGTVIDEGEFDLIEMEILEKVAPIIRNVAHPLRLRILDYLNQSPETRTVSEIMEAAEAGQAIVSQQLRILKDQGVLSAKRDGNFVRYGIADRSVILLLDCIRHHQKTRK